MKRLLCMLGILLCFNQTAHSLSGRSTLNSALAYIGLQQETPWYTPTPQKIGACVLGLVSLAWGARAFFTNRKGKTFNPFSKEETATTPSYVKEDGKGGYQTTSFGDTEGIIVRFITRGGKNTNTGYMPYPLWDLRWLIRGPKKIRVEE